MKIRILGAHNTESSFTRLASILIDGTLAMDAGGLTSSLSFRAQQRIKSILLTHPHYDHIRDIPAFAMNAYLRGESFNIYCAQAVYEALTTHFLNDYIYPRFHEKPADKPTINFVLTEPGKPVQVDGYTVLGVSVSHSVPAIGYQVTSREGKSVFYTGDTGPGLAECWRNISPQMIVIEVTASNRFEDFGRESRHLTPSLLGEELRAFRELKGYLPSVVVVHMSPALENEIAAEIESLSGYLNSPIMLAHEGAQFDL